VSSPGLLANASGPIGTGSIGTDSIGTG